jgi:hypothetical protein
MQEILKKKEKAGRSRRIKPLEGKSSPRDYSQEKTPWKEGSEATVGREPVQRGFRPRGAP